MALRARLIPTAPRPVRPSLVSRPTWSGIPAGKLVAGGRRMEAETYLSSGYGVRVAIEAKPVGWSRLGDLATPWMPGRLKGIQTSRDHGTPFIAAAQVLDLRPIPRKWLALEQTDDAEGRFVSPGTIVVTCSGTVGRSTLATDAHAGMLISHDLIRLKPSDASRWGWLYAFLLTPQAKAMMVGTQYGQLIKHLEVEHLADLPVPAVDDPTAADFARRAQSVLSLRNESHRATLEAERMFGEAFGPPPAPAGGGLGFTVRSSAIASGRRRLDVTAHLPAVTALRKHLAARGKGVVTIARAGYEVWLPTRFQRIPAENGVALWGSSALTELNPEPSKRIRDGEFGDPYRGRVHAGWVLMARSGQVYGIIGTPVLASAAMEGHVISDHVMRIRPTSAAVVPAGYVVTAMSHPTLGRPLDKALAYGSSVPEIDVSDIETFGLARLTKSREAEIGTVTESAAAARSEADLIEQGMARDAASIVERFTHRPAVRLAAHQGPRHDSVAESEFTALAERWRVERPAGPTWRT